MINFKNVINLTKDLNILYVEDDLQNKEQFESLFGKFFKKMYMASDGLEGLQIYEREKDFIDIIITDVRMPKMNGLDMSAAIRKENRELQIIVLSAHGDVEFLSKSIEIGVNGYILKPIDSNKLLETIYRSAKIIYNKKELERYKKELETLVEQKTQELELFYSFDKLGGCFNREKLSKDLQNFKTGSIAIINIDNFDFINSVYGFRAGDILIRSFADFLKKIFEPEGSIYRQGADEFVILWSDKNGTKRDVGIFSEKMALKKIDNFNALLKNHIFNVNDNDISITCTVGFAHKKIKDDSKEFDNLLVKAHIAIKEAREGGKNRLKIYSDSSTYLAKQKNNIDWMRKTKKAIEEDNIKVFYQSIVDNKTLKPHKYECLARIFEDGKIVSPLHFIEPARLAGLLPKITQIVFERACKYFSDDGKNDGFSINITEDDLRSKNLPKQFEKIYQKYNMEPKNITLEVLENISTQGSDEVLGQLKDLKSMGFLIAIDDFGSDKSNFYRLQKMDVDVIKIDGSFIKDIVENSNSQKITKSIVDFATNMGCKTVAEYVSSKDIFEKVCELGIDCSQGFYFSQPGQRI